MPPYYIGIDLASGGPDSTAAVVVDGNGCICDARVWRKTEPTMLVRIINELNEQYRPRVIAYDANGPLGKEVRGKLRMTSAKPIVTPVGQKAEHIKHFESHLMHRSIHIPNPDLVRLEGKYTDENVATLIKELREYRLIRLQRQQLRTQRVVEAPTYITYSKPPNGSDDLLDALVYACLERRVPVIEQAPVHDGQRDSLGAQRQRIQEGLGW